MTTRPVAEPSPDQHPLQSALHGPLVCRRHLMVALGASAVTISLPAWAQPPAANKGDILIGRSTALSGGMAPFLAPVHEGQEAAIDDANA